MDAAKRKMLTDILTHQLEGIMFHGDAVRYYELFDCKCKKREHIYRYLTEVMDHMTTCCKIIEEYGEILDALPGTIKRVKIFEMDVLTRPAEKAVREEHARMICKKWKEWEESTVELYEDAVDMMPECELLKKLHRSAMKELARIKIK